MKNRRVLRIATTLTAVLATVFLSSGAALAPSEPVATAGPSLVAGTTITLPTGTSVVLPEDFNQLSIAELARIGVVPGMSSAGTTSLKVSLATTDAVVVPMSATGCNKNVCIALSGSGLKVDSWLTQATMTGAYCTFASYWQGTTILSTSGTICGDVGDVVQSAKSGLPANYPNGAVLCNTWVNIGGKPCETVHS